MTTSYKDLLIGKLQQPGPDFGNVPPFVWNQTPDGVTWFALRDYGHRLQGLQEGTGAFLTFQSMNSNGTWGDWAMLNGGLISMEPGLEQGDLDMLVYVDGKVGGFAIVGDMTKFGGPDAGLLPIESGRMNIGSLWQRIKTLFVQELAIETVGKQIWRNNTWEWVDCIPIQTQQGRRWLPVYQTPDGS